MLRIAGSNFGRTKILAQHALRGAGLLDLGDDCSLTCGDLVADGVDKVAWRQLCVRFGTDRGKRPERGGSRYLLALYGEYRVEDIAHLK